MADIVDHANDLADALRSDAIEDARNSVPPERPELHEDGECECGMPIPYKRLRIGYDRCVSCSEYEERYNKQHAPKRNRCDYED